MLVLALSLAGHPKLIDTGQHPSTPCVHSTMSAPSLLSSSVPPQWMANVYREAEETWRNTLPWWKQIIEHYQDDIARDIPLLAHALDTSVGPYNIRPSTAEAALIWAKETGILAQFGIDNGDFDAKETVGFLMNDCYNTSIALLIIAQVKAQHPILRKLNWSDIERSDHYIAKLYSGYTGAGEDWAAWDADTEPGSVALQRLGYTAERATYSVVRKHRPSFVVAS